MKPLAWLARPIEREARSDQLLVIALIITVFVGAFGSAVLWRTYGSYRDSLSYCGPTITSPQGEPLVIGIARTPGGPSEWHTFAKVFARLEKDLQRPVLIRYTLSRAESQRLLRTGEADIAFMATQDYFKVQDSTPVTLVAAPIINGYKQDAAVLVVSSNSEIANLESLRGKRILLAEDLAGVAYARWFFAQSHTTPEDYFGTVDVGGVQDTNLAKVARGEADATCVRRSALATWPTGTFRVLSVSPEFGMSALVARSDVNPRTIWRIQQSMLSQETREAIPAASAIDGFSIPMVSDYKFARELQRARQTTLPGPSEGADR